MSNEGFGFYQLEVLAVCQCHQYKASNPTRNISEAISKATIKLVKSVKSLYKFVKPVKSVKISVKKLIKQSVKLVKPHASVSAASSHINQTSKASSKI